MYRLTFSDFLFATLCAAGGIVIGDLAINFTKRVYDRFQTGG